MMDTRLAKLKKDQETTQVVVSGLANRLEAVAVQIKGLQEQTNKNWGGVQSQLMAIENAMREGRDGGYDREQSNLRTGNLNVRSKMELTPAKEDRGSPYPKQKFPDFEGVNVDDWIYRSELYFELEQVEEVKKVRLASVHMYGKAFQWHYAFLRNRGRPDVPTWTEYVDALTKQFGKAEKNMNETDVVNSTRVKGAIIEDRKETVDYVSVGDEELVAAEECIVSDKAYRGVNEINEMEKANSTEDGDKKEVTNEGVGTDVEDVTYASEDINMAEKVKQREELKEGDILYLEGKKEDSCWNDSYVEVLIWLWPLNNSEENSQAIFAYGQTGSGKSYTRVGDICEVEGRLNDDCGIIPHMFEYPFTRIRLDEESRNEENLIYKCKYSFLEIYKEQSRTLMVEIHLLQERINKNPGLIQMVGVTNIECVEHKGRIAVGRLQTGVLKKGMEVNVVDGETTDTFMVSGRGTLHITILIEIMRREGYELMVGPPRVISKGVNDVLLEPYEIATVEVPEVHMGAVVELLGRRRGQMFDMQGVGSEGTTLLSQLLRFHIDGAQRRMRQLAKKHRLDREFDFQPYEQKLIPFFYGSYKTLDESGVVANKDFWRRRRRKLFIGLGILSGYCAYKIYDPHRKKLVELEREIANERENVELAKTQLQSHFENIQRIANTLTVSHTIHYLNGRISGELDLSRLTERLMRGKGQPDSLTPAEKLELWDQFKVLSFAKLLSSIWRMAILILFAGVQVNILRRHLYVDDTHGFRIPQWAEGDSIGVDDRQRVLAMIEFLSSHGGPALTSYMQGTTREVIQGKHLWDNFDNVTVQEVILKMLDMFFSIASRNLWVVEDGEARKQSDNKILTIGKDSTEEDAT